MHLKLGILFPGQGSQHLAMLAEVASEYSIVKETFSEASELLGYDLWQLAQQGPAEALAQTQITQPLMLVAGVSMWRVWQQSGGINPQWVAGHSLGEYTALVCADALDFSQAVQIVEKRARYMKEAVTDGEGAMAAILGLSAEVVTELCREAQIVGPVTPANFNTPEQTVIGGIKAAVEQASLLAKAKGAKKIIPVAMSVPSHCPLMYPAAERLKIDLDSLYFRAPRFPLVNNVDVQTIDAQHFSDVIIRDALARQIYSPVRWVEVIQTAQQAGMTHLFELGSGKVLTGLGKRIAPEIEYHSINDLISLQRGLEIVCQ